jgi:hypothetical protein
MRKAKIAAIAADRDKWMHQAFAETPAAAKDLITDQGPIRSGTPVGRLTDPEWGWISSSIVWAWISVRAEQAASEGWDLERAVYTSKLAPDPHNIGAIVSILPALFEACPDLDWSLPIGSWSKEAIAEFLYASFYLVERALAARDAVEAQIAGPVNADIVARRMNAAAGNPRVTSSELDDSNVPF